MIKKLVAFVVLLGAGFAILYASIGGESLAHFDKTSEVAASPPDTATQAEAQGVAVPLGAESAKLGDELTVTYEGGIGLKDWKDVGLPDGNMVQLPTYHLTADDSRHLPDGRQELRDVVVVFYETAGTAEEPTAVEAARLRADRAYVVLGTNDDGRRSVAKDKDIDLFDAVLETGDDSRVKGLRMLVEHARVRSTKAEVLLSTASDDLPIRVELLDDEGPAVLTGKGMRARFPMDAKQPREDGSPHHHRSRSRS